MADLHWISEGEHSYFAEGALGRHGIAQLLVERPGGASGWDWQVWDAAGRLLPRRGLANSPGEAKERASLALVELARQFEAAA